MNFFTIELTFVRDILGSQPANAAILREYIKKKMLTGKTGLSGEVAAAKIEEEIENRKKDPVIVEREEQIDELADKGLTIFHRNGEGKASICDIQLRGFFKKAFTQVGKNMKVLSKKDGSDFSGDEKYRKWIGDRISFTDQYYPLDGEIDIYTRPIRFNRMGHEESSLKSSERLRAPQKIKFEIVTNGVTEDVIKACLEQGRFYGISEQNNAQYGMFKYQILEAVTTRDA